MFIARKLVLSPRTSERVVVGLGAASSGVLSDVRSCTVSVGALLSVACGADAGNEMTPSKDKSEAEK